MARLSCYSAKIGKTDFGLEVIRFLERKTINTENFMAKVKTGQSNCNIQDAIDSFFRFIRSKARAAMRGTDKNEMTKEYIMSWYNDPATLEDVLIRNVLEKMPTSVFDSEFSRVRSEEAKGM
jgi:hypothetical protein